MTNTKELIIEIKRVRDEQGLSYSEIKRRMEESGDSPLSDATLSRISADGSEDGRSFSYDYTLLPLARAILDIDVIEEDDNSNVKALKEIIKLKHDKIKELEQALDKEKLKRHEQLDEVREQSRKSIEFLKEQVSYKDKRMDEFSARITRLLDRLEIKDERIEKLTGELIALKDLKEAYQSCPYKNGGDVHELES